MEKELLTIEEFAKLANKSHQTIYKQLRDRLNPFVQLVDNRKMLEYRALWEVYGIEVAQPIQPELRNSCNPILNLLESQLEQNKIQIDVLTKELEIKNKQIEELNLRLAEAHRMLDQSQQLHGADKALELNQAQEQKMIEDVHNNSRWWKFWKK